MSIDEILLLNDDQIDYAGLSDETLRDLALAEDMFIATSALSELRSRKSYLVVPVARSILDEALGDQFLRSSALETLFTFDQAQALTYISSQSAHADPSLVHTMMELMVENSDVFDSSPAATRTVARRVAELSLQEMGLDAELYDTFQTVYRDATRDRRRFSEEEGVLRQGGGGVNTAPD